MASDTSPPVPDRIPIVVKLGPLEEGAVILARHVAGMAHPEVPAPALPLLLDDPQHGRDATPAPRRVSRVQGGLVVPVRHVDAPVAGHGVRVDGVCRRDAVLPPLLHLGMHDQQRVVGQVDGDLAPGGVPGLLHIVIVLVLVLGRGGHDPPDAELPGYAQGQGADDGAGAEVGELVGVPAHGLGGPVVAVHEGGVGAPRQRGLVLELGAAWVAGPDAPLDLAVDGLADQRLGSVQLWRYLADVGDAAPVVQVLLCRTKSVLK